MSEKIGKRDGDVSRDRVDVEGLLAGKSGKKHRPQSVFAELYYKEQKKAEGVSDAKKTKKAIKQFEGKGGVSERLSTKGTVSARDTRSVQPSEKRLGISKRESDGKAFKGDKGSKGVKSKGKSKLFFDQKTAGAKNALTHAVKVPLRAAGNEIRDKLRKNENTGVQSAGLAIDSAEGAVVGARKSVRSLKFNDKRASLRADDVVSSKRGLKFSDISKRDALQARRMAGCLDAIHPLDLESLFRLRYLKKKITSPEKGLQAKLQILKRRDFR